MSITEILVGNPVTATVTFTTIQGEKRNPTAVTLRLEDPQGTITTPAPVEVGDGEWQHTWTPLTPGRWTGYFQGTGALEAAEEFTLPVRASKIQ